MLMTRANNEPRDFTIAITLLELKLELPGCASLKEKRGRIKPILNAVKRDFNVSVSEVGLQDVWQSTWVSCVITSNNSTYNAKVLNEIVDYIQNRFPDEMIIEHNLEQR